MSIYEIRDIFIMKNNDSDNKSELSEVFSFVRSTLKNSMREVNLSI